MNYHDLFRDPSILKGLPGKSNFFRRCLKCNQMVTALLACEGEPQCRVTSAGSYLEYCARWSAGAKYRKEATGLVGNLAQALPARRAILPVTCINLLKLEHTSLHLGGNTVKHGCRG
jgi:hypothetical protein